MSTRPALTVLLAAAALVASTAHASVTTYDLINDWSSSNPNGPWTYLQGSSVLPYQPSVDSLGGNPGFAPSPHYGGFLPLFWQTAGPGSDIFIHSVDSANGNPAYGEAILTWTAPAAGTIDLTGYLYYGQYGLDRSNDYTLALGADTLATGTLSYVNAYGPANEVPLSFTDLAVTKGEVLSLTLVRSEGQTYGTETGLDLKVVETSVPEPGGWALMLVGVGLAGAALRRAPRPVPVRNRRP